MTFPAIRPQNRCNTTATCCSFQTLDTVAVATLEQYRLHTAATSFFPVQILVPQLRLDRAVTQAEGPPEAWVGAAVGRGRLGGDHSVRISGKIGLIGVCPLLVAMPVRKL